MHGCFGTHPPKPKVGRRSAFFVAAAIAAAFTAVYFPVMVQRLGCGHTGANQQEKARLRNAVLLKRRRDSSNDDRGVLSAGGGDDDGDVELNTASGSSSVL